MLALLLAAALAGGATSATDMASVNTVVSFVHPEKFVDASDEGFGRPPSPRILAAIQSELERLGRAWLGPGQTLAIAVTDIDLAGFYEPARNGQWIRVLRDADWPRIALHYTLSQDGHVVREADARLVDMNYLHRSTFQHNSEPLYSEKRMLQDWFQKTFRASG